MAKIKLYIAASIDGYIARTDSDLDWLMEYPITPDFNYGYNDFFESVDSVIMGGKTYRDILNMDVVYPYESKKSYVITRNSITSPKENIYFVSDDVIGMVSELKKNQGKDIWLVGGGEIVALFLRHNLIDEMIVTTVPVILGNGIPLFPVNQNESQWNLKETESYKNGVIQVKYIPK